MDIDAEGITRFIIYDGIELHGDMGTQMRLVRKPNKPTLDRMNREQSLGPNSPTVLGNICSTGDYITRDWEVLGKIPPREEKGGDNTKTKDSVMET